MSQNEKIKVKGTHNDFTIYHFPMLPGRGMLDPVRVILNDYGPGAGGIILTCGGEAWTYYWGAMGEGHDIARFFTGSDLEYFVRKLAYGTPNPGNMTADEARDDYGATAREIENMRDTQSRYKSKMEYLAQIVKAARHAISLRPAPEVPGSGYTPSDTELLDALQRESWDLECFPMPTGGGDADIGWRVMASYEGEEIPRVVATVYEDSPRAAIRAAILAGRVSLPEEGRAT